MNQENMDKIKEYEEAKTGLNEKITALDTINYEYFYC